MAEAMGHEGARKAQLISPIGTAPHQIEAMQQIGDAAMHGQMQVQVAEAGTDGCDQVALLFIEGGDELGKTLGVWP